MKIISETQVHNALSYPDLVYKLKETYAGQFSMPPRNVYLLDENDHQKHDAFALLPSWNDDIIAVKSFTYFPDNPAPYKSLYSKIMLFDRKHGEPLALVDGTSCTFYRTAAMSALAADFLSRKQSKTMLLIGTGNLAPYLIKAHCSIRPLEKIIIWGRTPKKAFDIIDQVKTELADIEFSVANELKTACESADIIVCATGSPDILVKGDWVKPGTHTDFLGNHHADKRECDTELILKSSVYVDTYVNCFKEAGEILVPIEEGVFSKEEVKGEIAELCAGNIQGRQNDEEITLFKSVGSALSDLVAAKTAFQSFA